MNFCCFCQEPCGQREFCDESCYKEYQEEMAIIQASNEEDYPGESRYAGEDFDNEWDVQGGL